MSYTNGYRATSVPDHPRAGASGMVLDHVLIAEKALGRYLPDGVIVHHFDESRDNNKNNNLVICEDQAYHKLLHYRQRILAAGGNPNTDKICSSCKEVGSRKLFNRHRGTIDGRAPVCRKCANFVRRQYPQYR